MTTAAAASIAARAIGPLSRWLSVRHPLRSPTAPPRLAGIGIADTVSHGPPPATTSSSTPPPARSPSRFAAASAGVITRKPSHARLAWLFEQPLPARRPERLAA